MKKCPLCAEEIQDAAIVCKHCGRDLPKPRVAHATPEGSARVHVPATATTKPAEKKPSGLRQGLVLLAVIVGFGLTIASTATLGLGLIMMWVGIGLGLTGSAAVRWGGGLILACLISIGGGAMGGLFTSAPAASTGKTAPNQAAPPSPESTAQCQANLQCWGEQHLVNATVMCRQPVERMAKNDFQWTDGFLEPKFSRYRWKNQTAGEITYIGDKIKFQNGFGAWTYYIYECDMDATGERPTAVRASPGRLSH